MFPNVRLMVVAVLASIAALSCGFGVFAAFRVNHDPLALLPATSSPFQLVADNAAPPAVTLAAGQSFGARFQLNEALIAGAAARLSARKLDGRDSVTPELVAAIGQKADRDMLEPPAAVAPAPQTESAVQPDETAKNESPPAAPDSGTTQLPAVQASPKDALQEAKPEIVVAPAAAPAVEASHTAERKTASRQRIARARARVARARAIAQSNPQTTAFPQPSIQPAQPAAFAAQPAPQPVQRQIVLKVLRRAPAKAAAAKTTQPSQTAVGGPFVAPPTH